MFPGGRAVMSPVLRGHACTLVRAGRLSRLPRLLCLVYIFLAKKADEAVVTVLSSFPHLCALLLVPVVLGLQWSGGGWGGAYSRLCPCVVRGGGEWDGAWMLLILAIHHCRWSLLPPCRCVVGGRGTAGEPRYTSFMSAPRESRACRMRRLTGGGCSTARRAGSRRLGKVCWASDNASGASLSAGDDRLYGERHVPSRPVGKAAAPVLTRSAASGGTGGSWIPHSCERSPV